MVSWQLLDTGYCLAREAHLLRGVSRSTIHCHALVALIKHPQRGIILWDTGYAPRMEEATQWWPWKLYRHVTPLRLNPVLHLATQLPRLGIPLDSVRIILLSHLHADHVAGLLDFPHAHIVLHTAALEAWQVSRGWRALKRGVIPALFPPDFATRTTPIKKFDGPAVPGLGASHDLFGDGSILLVELPGHARGQLGAFLPTATRPVLLAADGAWLSRAFRERRPPHPLTYLFADDPPAIQRTLNSLHAFAAAHPDVLIVPTHCPEVFEREVQPV